ncbi:MAG: hypothetical protein ABL884_12420, partial [Methyloglobulus sp.]
MNIPNRNALALVIGLVISTGIMAEESMPKNKYESLGKQIDAVYDEDNAACNALVGNFKDICEATAKQTLPKPCLSTTTNPQLRPCTTCESPKPMPI